MRHRDAKSFWRDTGILAWLTAWLIAIPLIHVHPEAAHSHDGFDHAHKGITHTVFSTDCPDEFGAPSITLVSPDASGTHDPVFGQATHPFLDEDEIIFAFLAPSSTHGFDHAAPSGIASVHVSPQVPRQVSLDRSLSSSYPFALLSNDLAPRAPPVHSL